MKNHLLLLVMSVLVLTACKKNNELITPVETKLTYEVITSSGKWFGEYNDQNGVRAYVSSELPSGWKYEIKTNKPNFEMFVNATSSCTCFGTATSPDVTINFYVNDKLVKTEKNNWAKGVSSLLFEAK